MTLDDVITMVEEARQQCNNSITLSPSLNDWYRGKNQRITKL